MIQYVVSADGVRIAYERRGSGPGLILVGGLLCDRSRLRPLAEHLSRDFTVINYDRRGRGDSGDASSPAVEAEVADIAALLDVLPGPTILYGHSSGAGLALEAAARALPVSRLILHEPPYSTNDAESLSGARALATSVIEALDAGRTDTALRIFFSAYGLPEDAVADMAADPDQQRLAPTMRYDFEAMGELRDGGAIPLGKVRSIPLPTLVLVGRHSPSFFHDVATEIVDNLPNGILKVIESDHEAPPDLVAQPIIGFCN